MEVFECEYGAAQSGTALVEHGSRIVDPPYIPSAQSCVTCHRTMLKRLHNYLGLLILDRRTARSLDFVGSVSMSNSSKTSHVWLCDVQIGSCPGEWGYA